ncbi:MAG: hypothetical protein IJT96_00615 [Lachnospiraceae bacterium]|nr:hypothetical protein [Lachnospiraceae bacterium]
MLKRFNKGATKASLTIRLLIGAYLLYIDYQIFGDVMAREGASKYVMLAAMALFAVFGIFLIIMSAKALIRGETDDAEAEDMDHDNEDAP